MLAYILYSLLIVSSVLLFWQFLGYPLFMAIYAHNPQLEDKDYDFKPFISILVPSYNEENVIGPRIENLDSLDYPKDRYEIIIVESQSEDNTFEVASQLSKKYDNVEVIRETKRMGKASAINFGISSQLYLFLVTIYVLTHSLTRGKNV